MRQLIAALVITVLPLAGGFAQEKKDDKKPTLAIGDAAPPLARKTEWLIGSEPKAFEKGKVYVLHFFAPWDVSSKVSMPFVTELQKDNAGKGLVVIGLTDTDSRRDIKGLVTDLVKGLDFPVGFSDWHENYTAYVQAVEPGSIHTSSFVVGKDGKMAYIGRPSDLGEVVPKVLDGTWKGKADVDAMVARDKELQLVDRQETPEAQLEQLVAFVKKHPVKAKSYEVLQRQFGLLVMTKKLDDALLIGEEMIAISEKRKSFIPAQYVSSLITRKDNPDKKYLELGVKGLETAIKFNDKDQHFLLNAFGIYAEAGDKEKAAAVGKKLIEAIPEREEKQRAAMKGYVDDVIKKIGK